MIDPARFLALAEEIAARDATLPRTEGDRAPTSRSPRAQNNDESGAPARVLLCRESSTDQRPCDSPGTKRPKVVIVGGGFGGLTCATELDGCPVDVLLLDSNNYHLFTPLLYQVASALLNPSDIAYPLRSRFRRSRNVRFRQARVNGVDFVAKQVRTEAGDVIDFDWLVLATGSTNNYFGNQKLAHAAIGLKTLPEALRLRNHVLACLEHASKTSTDADRRRWLTFVVVGGGPTGVEYAGALVSCSASSWDATTRA